MSMNLVLLTIDSLRSDCATPESMPILANLADSGVRFSRAYSTGYSTPNSFPAILTGTYASHYGGDKYMSNQRPFLAERISTAGYETAAFHTNPHLRVEKNYHTGFSTYNDFNNDAGDLSKLRYLVTQNLSSNTRLYKILKRIYHLFRTTSRSTDYAEAPVINDRVLSWLDKEWSGNEPFFIWAHYMDVHYPFYPPDEFLKQVSDRNISNSRAISLNGRMHENSAELTERDIADLRSLYHGEVRYMDHHLDQLSNSLRERGLFKNTVFIVTSDHGELFGEGGIFGHPPSGYEQSYHVPLIMFGPGLPSETVVDQMATLLDIAPTITDLFDIDGDTQWEGESLLPAIRGEDLRDRDPVILGHGDVLVCQTDRWRLVWWRGRPNPHSEGGEWELWDLTDSSRVPLNHHEDVVDQLQQELYIHLERAEESESLSEPAVGEETKGRLEALGYR